MIAAATASKFTSETEPAPWDTDHFVRYLLDHGTDPFERSAALSAMQGREYEALDALLKNVARNESEGHKAVAAALVECALRSDGAQRARLIELAGDALAAQHPLGKLIIDHCWDFLRLKTDNPRILHLDHEPANFMALAPSTPRTDKVALYLEWPGRDPVNRPKRVRDLTATEQAVFERGKQVFTVCAGCHRDDGRGGAGMGAPLAGSERVHGRPEALVRILAQGFSGSYKINGTEYWGVMPPVPLTTDEEYAAVLTYIRRSWDNTADPVTTAQVGAIRSKLPQRSRSWTQEELEMLTK
jgi:mono/diheme cytochrome c family protein